MGRVGQGRDMEFWKRKLRLWEGGILDGRFKKGLGSWGREGRSSGVARSVTVGWTAMASLTAQMNPSVSPRSPLNFSGSAPLIGWIEVDEDVRMGRDCVAEAALVRLF